MFPGCMEKENEKTSPLLSEPVWKRAGNGIALIIDEGKQDGIPRKRRRHKSKTKISK